MNMHNLEIIYDSTCSNGSGVEDTESNIRTEKGKTERIGLAGKRCQRPFLSFRNLALSIILY
jgi:hypothetical protein